MTTALWYALAAAAANLLGGFVITAASPTGRATQRLSGASVVREDIRQAVIRAVLAAVNRRLEPMLAARELWRRLLPGSRSADQSGNGR